MTRNFGMKLLFRNPCVFQPQTMFYNARELIYLYRAFRYKRTIDGKRNLEIFVGNVPSFCNLRL